MRPGRFIRRELLDYGRGNPSEIDLHECPAPLRDGRGLDGYGMKIALGYAVFYGGRWRRVYCTCFSNSGTCWFKARSKTHIIG